jgi:hypothetical protein
MSDKKSKKYLITEAVLKQLPPNNDPIDKIINEWWFTRSTEGLRLSAMGDLNFRHAQIEFFNLPIKITQDNWHKFIVDCSKKIKCPYYFGVNKIDEFNNKQAYIRLYDSKIAMMIQLYGDIHSYLESVKVRK